MFFLYLLLGAIVLYLLWSPIRLTMKMGYGKMLGYGALGILGFVIICLFPVVTMLLLDLVICAAIAYVVIKVFMILTK